MDPQLHLQILFATLKIADTKPPAIMTIRSQWYSDTCLSLQNWTLLVQQQQWTVHAFPCNCNRGHVDCKFHSFVYSSWKESAHSKKLRYNVNFIFKIFASTSSCLNVNLKKRRAIQTIVFSNCAHKKFDNVWQTLQAVLTYLTTRRNVTFCSEPNQIQAFYFANGFQQEIWLVSLYLASNLARTELI